MKLAHVSITQRFGAGGAYRGNGGVELFAHLLQLVFPEMAIYSWAESGLQLNAPDDEKALRLNEYLLAEKLIDENTVVVGDGFWVNGLAGKVARCISVCHGPYAGASVEHEKYPWGDGGWLGDYTLRQEKVWRQPGVEIVAVSKRSLFELESICGLSGVVIEHGLPLDIFKPRDGGNGNKILHVAVSARKGNEMVEQVRKTGFEIEQLGYASSGRLEDEAALWQRGDILFMPSLFEGNSFALIEAIACGLVPVVYATGFAYDIPCWVGELTDDHHATNYAYLLEMVRENRAQYFSRAWAEERLDFDAWGKVWRKYLDA